MAKTIKRLEVELEMVKDAVIKLTSFLYRELGAQAVTEIIDTLPGNPSPPTNEEPGRDGTMDSSTQRGGV